MRISICMILFVGNNDYFILALNFQYNLACLLSHCILLLASTKYKSVPLSPFNTTCRTSNVFVLSSFLSPSPSPQYSFTNNIILCIFISSAMFERAGRKIYCSIDIVSCAYTQTYKSYVENASSIIIGHSYNYLSLCYY